LLLSGGAKISKTELREGRTPLRPGCGYQVIAKMASLEAVEGVPPNGERSL